MAIISLQDLISMSHNDLVIKVLSNKQGQLVNITTVSGEKITGIVEQFSIRLAYIKTEQNYSKEDLELAEKVFGREHVEGLLSETYIVHAIPIVDIQSIC